MLLRQKLLKWKILKKFGNFFSMLLLTAESGYFIKQDYVKTGLHIVHECKQFRDGSRIMTAGFDG